MPLFGQTCPPLEISECHEPTRPRGHIETLPRGHELKVVKSRSSQNGVVIDCTHIFGALKALAVPRRPLGLLFGEGRLWALWGSLPEAPKKSSQSNQGPRQAIAMSLGFACAEGSRVRRDQNMRELEV